MLIAHVRFPIPPHARQTVVDAFSAIMSEVRAMKGCIAFYPFFDLSNDEVFGVVHEWESAEDFATYGALVAANHPVEITVLSPLNTASVLFGEKSISPTKNLVVFEISPLCKELVRVCRLWGKDSHQDEYARRMFSALGAEHPAGRLAKSLGVEDAQG